MTGTGRWGRGPGHRPELEGRPLGSPLPLPDAGAAEPRAQPSPPFSSFLWLSCHRPTGDGQTRRQPGRSSDGYLRLPAPQALRSFQKAPPPHRHVQGRSLSPPLLRLPISAGGTTAHQASSPERPGPPALVRPRGARATVSCQVCLEHVARPCWLLPASPQPPGPPAAKRSLPGDAEPRLWAQTSLCL